MRATRAIIHLDNLSQNITTIGERLMAGTLMCVPVKADAYGHGAVETARAVLKAGATHLAVATVDEGRELREASIYAPILLLGIASPEELQDLVRLRLTPFITDEEYAGLLSHAARAEGLVCEVHLKVDSGMGRIGCSCAELPALARFVSRERSLKIAGIATHLAAADSLDADDRDYTRRQISSFLDAVESVRREGIDSGIVHAANSGAIVLHPEAHLDMVRPGILTYGYLPDECLTGSIEVVPVMELRTGVASIKRIQKGTSVSYGRTWTAERETEIATIPVGYDDGIPRAAATGLSVEIAGKAYPVVGRICMDQCMVDLGLDSGVSRWDEVTVFGPNPGAMTAGDVARVCGTIPYEITCGINKRVPRVYRTS